MPLINGCHSILSHAFILMGMDVSFEGATSAHKELQSSLTYLRIFILLSRMSLWFCAASVELRSLFIKLQTGILLL